MLPYVGRGIPILLVILLLVSSLPSTLAVVASSLSSSSSSAAAAAAAVVHHQTDGQQQVHDHELGLGEEGKSRAAASPNSEFRYIGHDPKRSPNNRRNRIHNDLYIHAKAHGFNYDLKSIANEFQLIDPTKIVQKHHVEHKDERVYIVEEETASADSISLSSFSSSFPTYPVYPNEYNITNVSPLLIDNNDLVTITFKTSNQYYGDWIGAYSPADVNISETVPVKFAYCDTNSTYQLTGEASLTFNFTNLRSDIAFYYFTGGLSNPVAIKKYDQVVQFKNPNEPLKPRIAGSPTGDVNSFQLLWSSNMSTSPVVKWGTETGVYTVTAAAETSRIEKADLCGYPANSIGWFDLGEQYSAPLTDVRSALPAGANYIYYIFGDNSPGGSFSREYRFRVPPLAGEQPSDRPTTVILYDDLGRGSLDMSYTWNEYGRPAIYTAMAVAAELDLGRVDAIYHGGDISYATGYLAVWDFYMEMMGPVTGSVVYLTTVGNHESDYPSSPSYYQGTDSGGECSVLTTKLMPMPYPAETNQPWWSYDTGLIHMIGLSTEHDYTTGSPQWEWLKADLQSINRTKTPWVIFGGHRAMYINSNYECMGENREYCGPDVPCTQVDNPDDYAPDDYITCDATEVPSPTDSAVQALLIKHIEPLLYQFKVDIGFYGHNHAVQRHSAVFNNTVLQASTLMYDDNGRLISSQVDPPCTIHMVVGTAGAFFTKNAMEPAPEWNELYFYEYGYAKVEATSPLELTWNWVNSETNEIMDTLVIKRTNSNPNQPPSTDGNSDDMTDGEIAAAVVCSILGFAFVASFIYFQFFRSKGQGQQQNEAPSDVFSPLGNGPRML